MSDQRPQYGEYATPEEQRRLAGLPPAGAAVEQPPAPAPAPQARPGLADRIVTLALLGYGLVNVVITAIAYLDLPSVMDESMAVLGIEGEFTNLAQGRLWGGIAAAVLVTGYALTVWLSLRRLRAGRRSWWVPIVGAFLTMCVVTICIMIPMLGDPVFMEYLQSAGQ